MNQIKIALSLNLKWVRITAGPFFSNFQEGINQQSALIQFLSKKKLTLQPATLLIALKPFCPKMHQSDAICCKRNILHELVRCKEATESLILALKAKNLFALSSIL